MSKRIKQPSKRVDPHVALRDINGVKANNRRGSSDREALAALGKIKNPGHSQAEGRSEERFSQFVRQHIQQDSRKSA